MGIYYTHQREEAWQQALKRGYLEASGAHTMFMQEDLEDFKPAYDWMVAQYEARVGISLNGNYPIWCWDEFPDLGRDGHIGEGNRGVVLTVELPDEEVLASEFSYWHHVLSDFPLYETLEEYDSDERPNETVVRKSWERIFDKAWCEKSIEDQPNVELIYQYVVHRIDLTQVRAVMSFTGRGDTWLDRIRGLGWRLGFKLGVFKSRPFRYRAIETAQSLQKD